MGGSWRPRRPAERKGLRPGLLQSLSSLPLCRHDRGSAKSPVGEERVKGGGSEGCSPEGEPDCPQAVPCCLTRCAFFPRVTEQLLPGAGPRAWVAVVTPRPLPGWRVPIPAPHSPFTGREVRCQDSAAIMYCPHNASTREAA